MNKVILLLYITSTIFVSFITANEAKIINAKSFCNKSNNCKFSVTIKHADEGWEHYVNAFEIFTPSNKLLSKRTLYHPHINEQPFTRNSSTVKIPKDTKKIIIKANDSVHGYSKNFILKL